jgi:hypothetical protein
MPAALIFKPPTRRQGGKRRDRSFGGLSFVRAAYKADSWQCDDIVGMWRFTMTILGHEGRSIAIEDCAEIMNSAAHAPN